MKGLFNKMLIAVFAILISPCFVACNDASDEPLAEIVSFSGIKELDIAALESQDYVTGYFELDVTGKWSVSSDKMWVTFSTAADGEYYYDIQGGTDIDKVYVKVSNVARGFAESNAVVSLMAGNSEKTVSVITRPAKSYEFSVLAENDDVLEEIAIGENATALVRFNANFECGILEYPDWLMEPVMESDGVRFNVVTDLVPMAQEEGALVVANKSLTQKYTLPISYVGMNPYIVNIEGDSPWGWIVSLDGQEFKKDKASLSDDSEESTIYGSLNMNIVCRDLSYKFVFTENNNETLYIKEGEQAWIKAIRDENDPKKVSVTVAEFEKKSSRSGYLFAVPDALYDDFKSTLEAGKDTITFAEKNDSIPIYNYVLADVIQKDAGFKVFMVDDDGSEKEIPCESDENADYYVKLSNEFTIDDVMACDVELGKSYIINTKLTFEDWPSIGDAYNGAWHDINAKKVDEIFPLEGILFDAYVKEHGDGYYRVYITMPEVWDEYENAGLGNNIILRLFTPDGVNIKALVLRVQK